MVAMVTYMYVAIMICHYVHLKTFLTNDSHGTVQQCISRNVIRYIYHHGYYCYAFMISCMVLRWS